MKAKINKTDLGTSLSIALYPENCEEAFNLGLMFSYARKVGIHVTSGKEGSTTFLVPVWDKEKETK